MALITAETSARVNHPPSVSVPESMLSLLEGYTFISSRRHALRSDAFRCRLLLRDSVCIGGPPRCRILLRHQQIPSSRRGAIADPSDPARRGRSAWPRCGSSPPPQGNVPFLHGATLPGAAARAPYDRVEPSAEILARTKNRR